MSSRTNNKTKGSWIYVGRNAAGSCHGLTGREEKVRWIIVYELEHGGVSA